MVRAYSPLTMGRMPSSSRSLTAPEMASLVGQAFELVGAGLRVDALLLARLDEENVAEE